MTASLSDRVSGGEIERPQAVADGDEAQRAEEAGVLRLGPEATDLVLDVRAEIGRPRVGEDSGAVRCQREERVRNEGRRA